MTDRDTLHLRVAPSVQGPASAWLVDSRNLHRPDNGHGYTPQHPLRSDELTAPSLSEECSDRPQPDAPWNGRHSWQKELIASPGPLASPEVPPQNKKTKLWRRMSLLPLQLAVLAALAPVVLLIWLAQALTGDGDSKNAEDKQSEDMFAETKKDRFEPPQIGVL